MPAQSSENDHTPVANLYRRYAPALLKYIRRHSATQEDAEDILLEVFIAALESNILTTLREGEQQAWLHRVAQNKCIDTQRRFARHPILPLKEIDGMRFDQDELDPEPLTMRQETQALLRSRVSSLTPIQQDVLRLRFTEELSCPEIARRLQKSEGAVRTLLSRTLNALRTIYQRHEEDMYHAEQR